MEIKVLFSGLTGTVGCSALKVLSKNEVFGIKITGGISRFDRNGTAAVSVNQEDGIKKADYSGVKWYTYTGLQNTFGDHPQSGEYDAVIAFDHADVFNTAVTTAVRLKVPLICGTDGLSDRQQVLLLTASEKIPVFQGGNFRLSAQKFADEVAKKAQTCTMPNLIETFCVGHPTPSETGKMLRERIFRASGQMIDIETRHWYPKDCTVCDWNFPGTGLHYQTANFDDLAADVLRITKVMVSQAANGKIYDLKSILPLLENSDL